MDNLKRGCCMGEMDPGKGELPFVVSHLPDLRLHPVDRNTGTALGHIVGQPYPEEVAVDIVVSSSVDRCR